MEGRFWSGTSNIVLPVPNKQAFPPEYRDQSRLTYYASLFNSLEVNASFYKLPQPATVKRWAASVPDDFRFTFKLWKEITHVKELAYQPTDLEKFLSVVDPAGHKLGCMLVQFPPSVTADAYGQLEALLQEMGGGYKVALEFRHPSWYMAETYELADEYGCSVVLHDIPKSRNSTVNKGAKFVYLRFHGPVGDYRGGYTKQHLAEQAVRIRGWMAEGREVYAYFNNTMGDAVKDLQTLNALVRAK